MRYLDYSPPPASGGGGGGADGFLEAGSNTFIGGGGFRTVTLAADPGAPFQVFPVAKGGAAVSGTIGDVNVEYTGGGTFRVYNSGDGGIEFDWRAFLTNV